jgi:hypothetical protein
VRISKQKVRSGARCSKNSPTRPVEQYTVRASSRPFASPVHRWMGGDGCRGGVACRGLVVDERDIGAVDDRRFDNGCRAGPRHVRINIIKNGPYKVQNFNYPLVLATISGFKFCGCIEHRERLVR